MAAIAIDKIPDHLMISKGLTFRRAVLSESKVRFFKGSSNGLREESALVELEYEHLRGDKKWVLVLFRGRTKLNGVLKGQGFCRERKLWFGSCLLKCPRENSWLFVKVKPKEAVLEWINTEVVASMARRSKSLGEFQQQSTGKVNILGVKALTKRRLQVGQCCR